jgi:hypothetical protein
MVKLWRDYNLSIVLAVFFLVSWALQTWMGWAEFAAEQQTHGQTPQVFGADGYIWAWGRSTFENWQSEFLQLWTFVVLTAYLVHKGSHESKDTDDKMQAQLDRIEQRLERIQSAPADARDGSRVGSGRDRRGDRAAPSGR